MISKSQSSIEDEPYGNSSRGAFCDRLVLPFVLARYKLHSTVQPDENALTEADQPRSLNSLPEFNETLSTRRDSFGGAASLTNLSPRNDKVDSIIANVKRRLSLKDEAKKQQRLSLIFNRTRNSNVSLKQPKQPMQSAEKTPENKGRNFRIKTFTSATKTPVKALFPMPQPDKFAKPNPPASNTRKVLRPRFRASSLPTLGGVNVQEANEGTPSENLKQQRIKVVRFLVEPSSLVFD